MSLPCLFAGKEKHSQAGGYLSPLAAITVSSLFVIGCMLLFFLRRTCHPKRGNVLLCCFDGGGFLKVSPTNWKLSDEMRWARQRKMQWFLTCEVNDATQCKCHFNWKVTIAKYGCIWIRPYVMLNKCVTLCVNNYFVLCFSLRYQQCSWASTTGKSLECEINTYVHIL